MKLSILGKMGLAAIGFCIVSAGSVVRADTVLLEDNFDAENGGRGSRNFVDFQNWTVEDGSVDLLGNGFYDGLPGNGLYVDLDGSTRNAGRLVSSNSFSFDVGDIINLSFDLIGSNGLNNVEVSLGNLFSETFTNNDIGKIFRTVEVTSLATDVALIFDHAGRDNQGLVLDNVKLTLEDPVTVAEPSSTIALLGLGVFGLGKAARDRKKR